MAYTLGEMYGKKAYRDFDGLTPDLPRRGFLKAGALTLLSASLKLTTGCGGGSSSAGNSRGGGGGGSTRRLSTVRICQMTGNYDSHSLPHINDTTQWAVLGTDMGCPVEFNGDLYLFCGDVPVSPGNPNPANADCIFYSSDTSLGSSGFHLQCVASNGAFRPLQISGYGYLSAFETPTGAFSYNGMLYVFTIRGLTGPYSSLTGASDPSHDFTAYYDISGPNGRFWQIAPWVVKNAEWTGLPSSSGDGLLMWGQAYNSVCLAWMPLQPGVDPPGGLHFYRGTGSWSTNETDVVPLFLVPNITQLSVAWLPGPQRWIILYTRGSTTQPHESIVCRFGTTPWTWSEEIILFNPDSDAAWGNFMHLPGSDDLNTLSPPWPDAQAGFAYAPYLLNRYTAWNSATQTVTLTYLMSTLVPYQIMLMQSEVQLG